MGIRDRKTIRDTRGVQGAQFVAGVSNLFAKGQQERAVRQEKEKKELQGLRRQAVGATKGYAERRAKFKESGIKSLDEQIVKLLDEKAREASNLYMKAFGPDGDEDAMFAYQQTVAQDAKDLDDLTVFVGTLSSELKRRDEGATKETLLTGKDEFGHPIIETSTELFKNGILDGTSQLKLNEIEGGGFEITDITGKMVNPINLTDYHETFKKEGSAYILANEELEDQINIYGDNIVTDDLIKTMKVGYSGEKVMSEVDYNKRLKELETEKSAATTTDDKKKIDSRILDLKKETKRTKGYKTIDRQTAYDNVYNKLSQDSKSEFKSYKKDGVIPKERDTWAFLQSNGYLEDINLNYKKPLVGMATINEDVAWDQYNNPDKMNILNQGMAKYLVDNQIFQGTPEDVDVLETDVTYKGGVGTGTERFNTK